jgi:multidrug resistance efflux pump
MLGFLLFALAAVSTPSSAPRTIRLTGVTQAVHSIDIRVPLIEGQGNNNLVLTKLIRNGAQVRPGDLLAEFDDTTELKAAREAQAKYDDLAHQVEQKRAEQASNAEKRRQDFEQAEADLHKAEIELRKGPILSAIDQEKNKVKVQDATEHVASLQRSGSARTRAEAAELRVLELQRDRQKIAVERAERNIQKLSVHAPIGGIVAMQNVFRNNSLGHAQEGDQLWPGSALLRLFDPSQMAVDLTVGEPDGAILGPGTTAVVHLDAFPQQTFTAHFESASPVATSALGSSVKTFSARFLLDQADPHLLPDLGAALDIRLSR